MKRIIGLLSSRRMSPAGFDTTAGRPGKALERIGALAHTAARLERATDGLGCQSKRGFPKQSLDTRSQVLDGRIIRSQDESGAKFMDAPGHHGLLAHLRDEHE